MAQMTASDAKNRFGQLLEMAQAEPVRIQKNDRDVAIVMSPEHYQKIIAAGAAPRVNPLVAKLHAESVKRWDKVYEALAK